jgi:predicted CxxxxCH...CXXCH cytochrome family protein
MRSLLIPICIAAAVASCDRPRPQPAELVTWREHVGPLFAERCAGCHAGESPASGYSVETYLDAIGPGSAGDPVAVAGDPESRLLAVLATSDHRARLGGEEDADERLRLVERWVVDAELAYFRSGYHPPGILYAPGDDFHGRAVAEGGWTMETCRSCHGGTYQGDLGGTCLSCHPATPEDCSTCHAAPEDTGPFRGLRDGRGAGVHAIHVTGSDRFTAIDCATCHTVPETFDAPGHLDGVVDVVFSGVAEARGATPVFHAESGTCSGSACHGEGLEGGTRDIQAWYEAPPAPTCTSCHGMPPETVAATVPHPASDRCESCHFETAGPEWTIADAALHGDGIIRVLDGAEGCSACHAGPGDAPPFRALDGGTDPGHPAVGAHDAHLHGGFFSAGMDCSSCHPDHQTVGDPGHMSGTVMVAFSGAAVAGGLMPSWDPVSRTCSNTWCHGGGLDGGALQSPPWNEPAALVCGSCHMVPPETLGSGQPHPPANTCGSCHGEVIDDGFGWVDLSRHVDGIIDTGGSQ